MEKNTVLLDVNSYNELRDFKINVESGKVVVMEKSYYMGNGFTTYHFYTQDGVVKEFSEQNEELKKKNEELSKIIKNNGFAETKELSISDLKKMNYFQFRKWKKSAK